jgi:uncharacterized protein (TIGR02757 family)
VTPDKLKCELDKLYHQYNRRRYVHPDPLEFLYSYKAIRDREIAGLIASALAYGRVAQILKSVAQVLGPMAPSPYLFLLNADHNCIYNEFKGFRHRFATGSHLAALLIGIKNTIDRFGSLYHCFLSGFSEEEDTFVRAMGLFSHQLVDPENTPGHLVALPEKGSACKRMNLFLRWMVRKDRVDPGGWKNLPPSKLLLPIDTHMHKIGLALQFTKRKQANMATALEITQAFKRMAPDDPVKYDFVLTRFGIRNDMDMDCLIEKTR